MECSHPCRCPLFPAIVFLLCLFPALIPCWPVGKVAVTALVA